MTELKTLKDIEFWNLEETKYTIEQKLKQEAIKWITELQKLQDAEDEEQPLEIDDDNLHNSGIKTYIRCYGDSYDYSATIFWIKHFFNISAEDLK